MMVERILIVDDQEDLARGVARTLQRLFPKIKVKVATSGDEALARSEHEAIDLALVDIRMPGMDGLELLSRLRERDHELTVLIMTGHATIETAVDAIKRGAYDFITKPFDRETLRRVVGKALERNRLVRENLDFKRRFCGRESVGGFVGRSEVMQRFYESLQTVAHTDYTVLIRGESGTGKELAARAVHELSGRQERPLVMVNCPAIPENLLESELFGHRRGAFTGADRDHKGLFAEADGGTICLDEIADIPVTVQTKLLRVLQEQEVRPLGATATSIVDVRVIAVTNQDLEAKIAERSFREDLFYRLNVVTLHTPALREIAEDIPLLAEHFAQKACCELKLPEKRLSPATLEMLVNRAWPGNVRQLQNAVRQAVMFSRGEMVVPDDFRFADGSGSAVMSRQGSGLNGNGGEGKSYKDAKEEILNTFTGEYVVRLLADTGGNVSRAARQSGLTRAALQKIMRRVGIDPEEFR
jgi:DNA-binding NtrC family response regulator